MQSCAAQMLESGTRGSMSLSLVSQLSILMQDPWHIRFQSRSLDADEEVAVLGRRHARQQHGHGFIKAMTAVIGLMDESEAVAFVDDSIGQARRAVDVKCCSFLMQ